MEPGDIAVDDGTKGADAQSLGTGDHSGQLRIRVERLKEYAVSETAKMICIDGVQDRTIAKRNSINPERLRPRGRC